MLLATAVALLCLAAVHVTAASAGDDDADWTGHWSFTDNCIKGISGCPGTYYFEIDFVQTGTSVVGTGSPYTSTGTASGSTHNFTVKGSPPYTATFHMTMSKDGKSAVGDATDSDGRVFKITATGNGRPAKTTRPDGVDWTVPDRLASQVSDWTASEGLPPIKDVYPGRWSASVFLTSGGKPFSCPGSRRYRWEVGPPDGAKVLDRPQPGCKTRFVADRLGRYRVTPIEQKQRNGRWVDLKRLPAKPVVLHDWLITAFGDSNGSGEGNGPFEFGRCNRSLTSYQYRTAEALEKRDRRTSVTLAWPSCSGAVIEHLDEISYSGINSGAAPLPPQIKQVATLVTRPSGPGPRREPERKVDVAIVSAGVNNIAFGPTIGGCVKTLPAPCEGQLVRREPASGPRVKRFVRDPAGTPPTALPVRDRVTALISALPSSYDGLARAFARRLDDRGGGTLGVEADHVFITQYPDFTTDDAGNTCVGGVGTGDWPQSTWQFFDVAGQALNRQVLAAGQRHGWTVVGLGSGFAGHGYCASDSYIKGVFSTSLLELNTAGPFHPNRRGHGVTAAATTSALCSRLYGNPDCSGKPSVLR